MNGTLITKDNYCNYFDIGSYTSDITFGGLARNTNCGVLRLATDESAENEPIVVVFPNPARGSFTVRYPGERATIRLLNPLGRPLRSVQSLGGTETFGTAPLHTGLYVAEVDNGGERTVRKVLVQN